MSPNNQDLRTFARVLPALVALAAFVVVALFEGGIDATTWYPAALLVAGVTCATAIGGGFCRPQRPVLVAVAALGLFTAWNFASIGWSAAKGDAWDGANRTLLYLVVYLLFALLPWADAAKGVALGGYSVAIGGIALVVVWNAAAAADPYESFLVSRFAEPIGYQNGACALFLGAAVPAVALAAQREVPPVARALLVAAGAALVEVALLSQSRGSLVAAPFVLVLLLFLAPRVLSLLAVLVVVGGVTVASAPTLLHVFTALESVDEPVAAVDHARVAVFVSTGIAFLLGLGVAVPDRRRPIELRSQLRIKRGTVALLGCTAAVLVALALDAPSHARTAWHEFKQGNAPLGTQSSYFTAGFGSNRYDIWRVAVDEIRRHPVLGVGSDNFAVDYYRERRSDEEPTYPHSVLLRVPAQTGVVGSVLFAVFVAAALWAALDARRSASSFRRGAVAACLAAFGYWAAHGAVDWFWELPALTAPAFGWLGMAAAGADRPLLRPSTLPKIAIGVMAIVIGALLALPWLAALEMRYAAADWRSSARTSLSRLDTARELNPLSVEPDLLAGAIDSRLRRYRDMRAAFTRAVAREPTSWYGQLELAAAATLLHRPSEARRRLDIVRRLNPREPAIEIVARALRTGTRLDPGELDRLFLRRRLLSQPAPQR